MSAERHNKHIPIQHGNLKEVIQVDIVDEESWLKEHGEVREKYQFSTTMGDYDPDWFNWYAVIEKIGEGEEALVIVRRP